MFTLSPATLTQLRNQAEMAMQDEITFYNVDVTRDIYGAETVVSGVVGTYSCLIGGIGGKDEEVVTKFVTDGFIKNRFARCLLPWNADVDSSYVGVVNGTEWRVVWENSTSTENYRLYTKAYLMRDTPLTEYPDHYRRNG